MRHSSAFALASLVFTLSLMFPPQTLAADKQTPSRWSLDDWLKQKQRNGLMDQWLALHSSSPYEFFVGGGGMSTASHDAATGATDRIDSAGHARVGAYASIVGLEGRYESWPTSKATSAEGSFHLRVLGTSIRSTHLDIHYGLDYRVENGEAIRAQSPGAELTIMLIKTFGISGRYDWRLAQDSDQSQTWSGSRMEGEAFIDFSSLRIFGRYTRLDDQIRKVDQTRETRTREGLGGGLELFF